MAEAQEDGSKNSGSQKEVVVYGSNRVMRNMAEKMRRDKLNFFINELSTLVPIISFSPKKLDKTSILRLAATYIRLHNVIFGSVRRDRRAAQANAQRQMLAYLPQYLASFNWSENVLEEMDGMLMIVSGAGRIIFISHTVEKLLGHTQIELMGQSLYNLTCLEDYDELKRNLAPDEDPSALTQGDVAGDESSCDSSSGPATPPPRLPTLPFTLDSDTNDQRQRRSFYIRLRQRAQSRSDQPQYELVHVVGHLRVPPSKQQGSSSASSNQPVNLNDITLVAVVKPFKEKRITTLSLLEACREEFITRHTLDGRIIYTDHRISIVAGYLSEEVCGVPGFQYMHKEDMRWTMVGLRQMFFRGSSYGQSCYRLQTKNGKFIYLKTCGYLELSENNDSFQSLICINSLVTATEGEALIRQMKEQYSPVIKNKTDKNMEILSSNFQKSGQSEATKNETEDPKVLEAAISQMISNVTTMPPSYLGSLSSPTNGTIDPSEAPFVKATIIAKTLPPLAIQTKKVGIMNTPTIKTPAAMAASLSPPASSQHSPPHPPSPPGPLTPQTPLTPLTPHTPHTPLTPLTPATPHLVQLQQDRPSVVMVAAGHADHQVLPVERMSVVKMKRMRTDEQGQDAVMTHTSVAPLSRSVLVSPPTTVNGGGKRKSDGTVSSTQWNEQLQVEVSLSPGGMGVGDPLPPTLSPSYPDLESDIPCIELLQHTLAHNLGEDFLNLDSSPPSLTSNLEMYDMWPSPQEPDPVLVENSHRSLDTRMQYQGEQIHEIEHDLEKVPVDDGSGQVYNSKLSRLQVEHRRQQQLLRSLQQDHQTMTQSQLSQSQQHIV